MLRPVVGFLLLQLQRVCRGEGSALCAQLCFGGVSLAATEQAFELGLHLAQIQAQMFEPQRQTLAGSLHNPRLPTLELGLHLREARAKRIGALAAGAGRVARLGRAQLPLGL